MIELISNKIFLDDNHEIREYYTEKGDIRALISNECIQSLIFIDEEKRNDLGLEYFKFYDLPIDLNLNGHDYLMLGGGTISYPHHYINKFKDKNMDIVEINEKCIDYAQKYFYLDKLIENNQERLNIIIQDAIIYLKENNKKYDYILIDLFNGNEPVKEIYLSENLKNLKEKLKENGVIIVNYIISNKNLYTYKEELQRLIKVTNNYKIITHKNNYIPYNNIGNIIIVLSNNEIKIPTSYDFLEISNIIN